MIKEFVKKRLDEGKKFRKGAYDFMTDYGNHLWANKTDYMIAYMFVWMILMERDLNRRFDRMEKGSIHVSLSPEEVSEIKTWGAE